MPDSGKGPRDWKPATRAVRGGLNRSQFGELAEAMYLTSGYAYDSAEQAAARMRGDEEGFVYSRYGNPTVGMLEERLALIEGAEMCKATASGMGAISTAVIAPCQQGDRVVASRALFGSCQWIVGTQLPRMGVETEFVRGDDMAAWEQALSKPTRLVLIETPSNPLLDGVDIPAIAALCKKVGAILVVDNVFATPILQKPFELGADVVAYSATKHLDGQGRVLAGAILTSRELMEEIYLPYYRHTGPACSPFNAWTVLKGLETLDMRVRAASASAARLADLIADHPNIRAVRYPGRSDHPNYDIHRKQMSSGGTLIAFSVKGGQAEAFRFLNGLTLVDIANNLGDSKSLACHPCTTTHRNLTEEERAEMGLDESWIRLSVGLEDAEDLAEDLTAALDSISA